MFLFLGWFWTMAPSDLSPWWAMTAVSVSLELQSIDYVDQDNNKEQKEIHRIIEIEYRR